MIDHELARLLLEARRGPKLPTGPAPADPAQATRVQALVMAELGAIGGWKVGAPGPGGPISCAPLPASTIFVSPQALGSDMFTQRDVESEICFVLGADLPARGAPHARDAVLAAIASCRPGIEILQSRYAEPEAVGSLALLADFIQSGAYITGEAIADWRTLDFDRMSVEQAIEHGPVVRATGNPAGDMIRLLLWLANDGSHWAGGLHAGQVITCGSWTGKTRVPPGRSVTTRFAGAAPVSVRFLGE